MVRICKRCVLDETIPAIRFDGDGNCNYCNDLLSRLSRKKLTSNLNFENFINKIKKQGHGKQYDCVVGVSGGVDSSFALDLACRNGLRPMAVHLDNGWDSAAAQKNIFKVLSANKVPLHTHVIDWKENRDLQRSFFKSNVIDIEMLMDNAQAACNFKVANKYGVKYILSGTNISTEGMNMPPGWTAYKFDVKNIRDIHKKFGSIAIKTHPLISTLSYFYMSSIKRIRWINFLDYVNYDKETATEYLINKYGYTPYFYKHGESVFTRLYQNFILPQKFGVDKRKIHLSTLVSTNQLSRKEALNQLENNQYLESDLFNKDFEFCKKKLGFDDAFFKKYIAAPPAAHSIYASELPLKRKIDFIYKKLWQV